MAAITQHGNCGQLLDLHNLYCNAVNHGFDAFAVIDRITLDKAIEIHVTGGRWEYGYWGIRMTAASQLQPGSS
jgi:uncharacterized protein (UPF0276 family)